MMPLLSKCSLLVILISLWIKNTCGLQTYYLEDLHEQTLRMSELNIAALRLKLTTSPSHLANVTLSTTIEAPTGNRLMVRFVMMDMHLDMEGECQHNFLHLLEKAENPVLGTNYLAGKKLCGNGIPQGHFETKGENLTFHFQSADEGGKEGFEVILTAFHTGPCEADEHQCDNGWCILSTLYPCEHCDHPDDADCEEAPLGLFGISIISLCGLMAVILLIASLKTCRVRPTTRKHMHRQSVTLGATDLLPFHISLGLHFENNAKYSGDIDSSENSSTYNKFHVSPENKFPVSDPAKSEMSKDTKSHDTDVEQLTTPTYINEPPPPYPGLVNPTFKADKTSSIEDLSDDPSTKESL